MGRLRKNFGDFFAPVAEDRRELPADPEAFDQPADRAPADRIRHVINHVDAAGRGYEPVLVVPEPVGAEALLIDEELALTHVGDLGEPPRPDSGQNADAILDHLAGKHAGREVADDLEAHAGGRERVEIARRGEKFPNARGIARDELLAVEMTNHGSRKGAGKPAGARKKFAPASLRGGKSFARSFRAGPLALHGVRGPRCATGD